VLVKAKKGVKPKKSSKFAGKIVILIKNNNMNSFPINYTFLPIEMIYRNRVSLDDFDVDAKNSVNGQIFRALMGMNYFAYESKQSESEIIEIFNDVYSFCTLALLEKRPYMYLGQFVGYARQCRNKDFADEREAIVMTAFWCVLESWKYDLSSPLVILKDNLKKMIDGYEEIKEDIAQHILDVVDTQGDTFLMDDLAPRDIMEWMSADSHPFWSIVGVNGPAVVAYAAELLCRNKKERLLLVDRAIADFTPNQEDKDTLNEMTYRELLILREEIVAEPDEDEATLSENGSKKKGSEILRKQVKELKIKINQLQDENAELQEKLDFVLDEAEVSSGNKSKKKNRDVNSKVCFEVFIKIIEKAGYTTFQNDDMGELWHYLTNGSGEYIRQYCTKRNYDNRCSGKSVLKVNTLLGKMGMDEIKLKSHFLPEKVE
jgi:hypothetical protein